MANTKIHVVTGPLASVIIGESVVNFYRGAHLPDTVPAETKKHLVAVGLVETRTVEDTTVTETPAVEIPDGAPVEAWSAEQLAGYIDREQLDVKKVGKKADVVTAIEAALKARADAKAKADAGTGAL